MTFLEGKGVSEAKDRLSKVRCLLFTSRSSLTFPAGVYPDACAQLGSLHPDSNRQLCPRTAPFAVPDRQRGQLVLEYVVWSFCSVFRVLMLKPKPLLLPDTYLSAVNAQQKVDVEQEDLKVR